jgi:4-hydroxyphenylpyruvate dioxygenase
MVSDLESVMEKARAKGTKVLHPIQQQPLTQGGRKWAKIAAWGSLTHTLSEYIDPDAERFVGDFPAFPCLRIPVSSSRTSPGSRHLASNCELFSGIDHVVLNVAAGDLERALNWYEVVLGFQRQQTFAIQTDRSGLRSQVMIHPDSGVKFPINEPASANSQIQEFLDVNRGAGIQHIALQTPDLVNAIARLRALGLSFLPVPATYYTQLQQRQPKLHLSATELAQIAAQQILVDWQDSSPEALLLQIFTQPIFKEPTFFFELIERRYEAQGFGEGNFRALFEAIEREQYKRGSLGTAKPGF